MTLMAATLRLGPWAVGAMAAYNGSPPDFRQAGWSSWACAPVWSAAMTAALLDLPQDPVALRELNADLHCHSTVSDGTLPPAEVAARAARNGVQLWALTDHDEIGGLAEAAAAARDLGLPFLTGTEISVSFAGETVHIVGLGFDAGNENLRRGLSRTRGGREERAREMAAGLAQVGIHGAYEGALQYVGNPELISRTHFARWLVERGHCQDTSEVFRRFLTPGRPGFVEHRWATLREAITWISEAGGVAVVAHPGRYDRLSVNAKHALMVDFQALGGRAIEVVTGSHTVAEYQEYAQVAQSFGLAASRGSDFHSPEESHIDLGQLPALPYALTPVWSLVASRIQA